MKSLWENYEEINVWDTDTILHTRNRRTDKKKQWLKACVPLKKLVVVLTNAAFGFIFSLWFDFATLKYL